MTTATRSRDDVIVRKLALDGLELKADDEGAFRATIATFNTVDHDGEVTLAGAFPEGKKILVSAYMHTSWDGALPVGSGVVHQDQKKAWVEGKFWLDTEAGKQHYLALKNALADGVGSEWSYGFRVMKSSTDAAQLEKYDGAWRILEQVDPFEASPVLRGAGIDTRTEYVKSGLTLAERGGKLATDASEFLVHARATVAMRAKEGRVISTANAERIGGVADALEQAAGVLRQLLKDATPAEEEDGDGKSLDWLHDAYLAHIQSGLQAA